MKLPAWVWVIAVVVLVAVGFLLVKQPKPIIELAPEKLWTIGGFTITNTILTAWLVIIAIAAVLIPATRNPKLIPSGMQNAFESFVEGFQNIVVNVAGEANGRRFFPVVFTLLFYILVANWLSLLPVFNIIGLTENVHEEVHRDAEQRPTETAEAETISAWIMQSSGITLVKPGAKDIKVAVPADTTFEERARLFDNEVRAKLNIPAGTDVGAYLEEHNTQVGKMAPFLRGVNSDVNSPLAYAVWSAIFVELWGITALGFFSYGSKFINFKRLLKGDLLNGFIDVFVGILELVSELARLISFTFRLFGNIFAGEVLLFMMSFLVPFVLVDVFYGLELFVGLIQAFVFAMLTLVFGVMAVASHGDHEEHGEAHGASGAAHQEGHA